MDDSSHNFKKTYPGFLTWKLIFYSVLFPMLAVTMIVGCSSKPMTVEKAKTVSISIGQKTYTSPPPRRIDDILSILDQPGYFDPELAQEAKRRVEAQPPQTKHAVVIASFYERRALAAVNYGNYGQYLDDLRTALKYCEKYAGKFNIEKIYARVLWRLGDAESFLGNFNKAMVYAKKSLEVFESAAGYSALVNIYFMSGDFRSMKDSADTGIAYCDRLINEGADDWVFYWKANMTQLILKAQGRYADAEPHLRTMIDVQNNHRSDYTGSHLKSRAHLAINLMNQDRLLEAELEAREAIREAIGFSNKESGITLRIGIALVDILRRQERQEEAEKLMISCIQSFERTKLSKNKRLRAFSSMLQGDISAEKLDFHSAMKQYDKARALLKENRYLFEKNYARNPYLLIAHLKTKRFTEVMPLISSAYEIEKQFYGENHHRVAILLGLRGMAHAGMKNFQPALQDFSNAIPILIDKRIPEANVSIRIILESYLEFLGDIYKGRKGKDFGIDPATEAFQITNSIYQGSVQKALGASGARAAVRGDQLAGLVRNMQDTQNKIKIIEAATTNILAASPDQQNQTVLSNLKRDLAILQNANAVIQEEITRRFPKYSDFINPSPATITDVQKHLQSSEVLISIYAADQRTYLWAIPRQGKAQFAVVPIGSKYLQQTVHRLRQTIAAESATLGGIPAFDLRLAHTLYNKLLKPVESGWKNATDLIIVAPGPLGQLPFALLPTNSVKLGAGKDVLFAKYRKVPWLIRKVSITRQPSVSSFITLRKLPEGNPNRKAFVGFGDPFFNKVQLAEAQKENISPKIAIASIEDNLSVRGVRVTKSGNLDNKEITSSHLGFLNRLPETREEILSIAETLGANSSKDIFLGKRASEKRIKTEDYSDRRFIVFATHALLPGDLDGLDQPALALSAPAVTGDDEDGLLTMREILGLKLNADWILLSACNTGAADGDGAEALTGLGRACFYAGTKAILVSMWAVESTSAKKITTGLFKSQRQNSAFSRAKALQNSILRMIDEEHLRDGGNEKIIASYAHPFFWAPFVIVGDGR